MSGWEIRYARRWRFYPAWMPLGIRRVKRFTMGGDFIYGD